MFGGTPQHPVALALVPTVAAFNLREEHLQAVIDGMTMDLDQNRYLDFVTLELYCDRVAGVVGLMSAEIFGYHEDRPRASYARDLGIAFQLTNIIRDVGEDATRGRIYLPQDELARHGVTAADLFAAPADAGFHRADDRAGGARADLLRQGAGRAAEVRPPRAAAGTHHGGHLPGSAARDRARRLPRARPADQLESADQGVARLARPRGRTEAAAMPELSGSVAIVGGGWAGMAAAVTLAAAGRPVTVFEAGKVLGGRARRVEFEERSVDNGQHILLGAYAQTLALLRTVHGERAERELFDRRRLHLEQPGVFRLKTPPLPAPVAPRGRAAQRARAAAAAIAWPRWPSCAGCGAVGFAAPGN